MLAVMYHYVRLPSSETPRLKFLHLHDFQRQLDMFERTSRIIGRAELYKVLSGEIPPPADGVILTFDDGLADHYEYVFPELQRRGLWGVFYIPTLPYSEGKMLVVHMLHRLLAKYPADQLLQELIRIVTPEMVCEELMAVFQECTYNKQVSSSSAEKEFKRLVNYFLLPEHKQAVTRQLFDQFFPNRHDEICAEHYLDVTQMKEMAAAGMEIGGHSVSHTVLSSQSAEQQGKEINCCMDQLREMIGKEAVAPTFCYPYGGAASYNMDTLLALKQARVQYCFDVRSDVITATDIEHSKLRLPRYDCNEFAFGNSWLPRQLKKAVVFTSNQPRHLHLIQKMADVADEVIAVLEASRVAAPSHDDPVLREYFSRVKEAEASVFGGVSFLPKNVRTLVLGSGDATSVFLRQPELLDHLNSAELCVVFGASWLRSPLCEALASRNAINMHAGVSPFFRGCATNFWSIADGRPDLTGITIHCLTAGLDSGPILFHSIPRALNWDPFELGMDAIKGSHLALINHVMAGTLFDLCAKVQDRSKQIRYARGKDFDLQVAADYLGRVPTKEDIGSALSKRDLQLQILKKMEPSEEGSFEFVNPYVM